MVLHTFSNLHHPYVVTHQLRGAAICEVVTISTLYPDTWVIANLETSAMSDLSLCGVRPSMNN